MKGRYLRRCDAAQLSVEFGQRIGAFLAQLYAEPLTDERVAALRAELENLETETRAALEKASFDGRG